MLEELESWKEDRQILCVPYFDAIKMKYNQTVPSPNFPSYIKEAEILMC